MKNFFLLPLLTTFLFLSCSKEPEFKGTFSFWPEFPKAGETVTIRYSTDSTKLYDAKPILMTAYFYNYDIVDAVSSELNEKPDGFYGELTIPKNAYGVMIKFTSGEILDNNNKKSYLINVYDENEMKVPGSMAGYAQAATTWAGYYLETEMSRIDALNLIRDDIKASPDIKAQFISSYFSSLKEIHPEKKDSIFKAEVKDIEKKSDLNEQALTFLFGQYSGNEFNDSVKAEKFKTELRKRFPESRTLQMVDYRNIRNESDFKEQKKLIREFEKKYQPSEVLSAVYRIEGDKYIEQNNIDSLLNLADKIKNKVSPYFYYSAVTKILESKRPDLNKTYKLAQTGIEAGRNQLNEKYLPKDKFETPEEYQKNNEMALGYNLLAAGKVLMKMQKTDEAVPMLDEAVNLTNDEDPDLNNVFVKALDETKNYDKVISVVENFITKAKSTAEMKELLKKAYVVKNGSDSGFEAYLSKFEGVAQQMLFEKVKSKMISEKAPDFTLEDLNNKKVKLSSLKGKVVVLDFWATWCGPCISSFPAMQKTVDDYKDNKNVRFLFINSWERVEDKFDNASNFVSNNNYTFQVLIDEKDDVIKSYNVSGIPTKFIIDKEGNIRFKSVGYSGNNDELIEELKTMISLVN